MDNLMIILLLIFFLVVIICRNRENLKGRYLRVGDNGVVEGGKKDEDFDDYLEKDKEYKNMYNQIVSFRDT